MEKEILEKLANIEQLTLLAAKPMLTIEDVSKLTGLSKSYLYQLTSQNQIPHYKPQGGKVFFDRQELTDWLKQNRIATTQETNLEAQKYITRTTGSKGYKK